MAEEERVPASPDHHHHDLRNTSVIALVILFVLVIALFVALSEVTGVPAEKCSWCEPNAFDEGVRRLLYVESSRNVGLFSHILSFIVAPGLAIAAAIVPGYRSKRRAHGHHNFAIVLSCVVLTVGMTDGMKKLFARERPGFHHGRELLLEAANVPLERNVSFFSGDTSIAFAFIAAAFAICHLRGYKPPRWLVISGAFVAFSVAVMRVVADMHWATDVMVGALVGTALGAGVPLLVHRRHIAPAPK